MITVMVVYPSDPTLFTHVTHNVDLGSHSITIFIYNSFDRCYFVH